MLFQTRDAYVFKQELDVLNRRKQRFGVSSQFSPVDSSGAFRCGREDLGFGTGGNGANGGVAYDLCYLGFLLFILRDHLFSKGEDALPIAFHGDDDPVLLFGLGRQGVAERADGRFRSVFELASWVVVMDEHH
jgi:hypothetical protein